MVEGRGMVVDSDVAAAGDVFAVCTARGAGMPHLQPPAVHK